MNINEADDAFGDGPVDSILNTCPLLHSSPATVPRIRENDRNSDKQNIREVTTTDMSVTQLSSLRHTFNTSGTETQFYSDLDILFTDASISSIPVIILGDFNVHFNDELKFPRLRNLLNDY